MGAEISRIDAALFEFLSDIWDGQHAAQNFAESIVLIAAGKKEPIGLVDSVRCPVHTYDTRVSGFAIVVDQQ
jgi:hypothetical protein